MPRIRSIRHDLFLDEELAEAASIPARFLLTGLWTIADKQGRLEDRPKRIKAQIYPYDDVDVDALLRELSQGGQIVRYIVNGMNYIEIASFLKTQKPHPKEVDSDLPGPEPGDFMESREKPVKAMKKHEVLGIGSLSMGNGSGTSKGPPSVDKNAHEGGFDAFWREYPRKVGKQAARKAWKKRRPGTQLTGTIVEAIQAQVGKGHFQGNDGQQYIPNPATWLNQERWEDEIAPSVEEKRKRKWEEISKKVSLESEP